jgi:hypothetical protein
MPGSFSSRAFFLFRIFIFSKRDILVIKVGASAEKANLIYLCEQLKQCYGIYIR